MRRIRWQATMGVLLVLAGAVPLLAQAGSPAPSYPTVKLSGRLQEQFYWFDNGRYAASVGAPSNFFTRRARIEARAQLSEAITVFLQPSYEGGRNLSATTTCTADSVPAGGGVPTIACKTTGKGGVRLRDAWIEYRLGPAAATTALIFRAGQEKRPFGRYELTSSVNLPSIERGAGAGLPGKASNNLFEDNGFLAHDVGASARLEHGLGAGRSATLKAGVYNGRGESLADENGGKSFGARGTIGITSALEVGASWFRHERIQGADSSFHNSAWGVDASYGKPGEAGSYLVVDYMTGEDQSAVRHGIRGLSVVAAYQVRTRSGGWLYAVEPAFRFDIADPNTGASGDRVTTISAVLGGYLTPKTQLRIGVERQSYEAGTPAVSGIRSSLAVSF